MESNSKPFAGYYYGYDFWNDTAITHGVDEAIRICGTYLDMQLKTELSDDEVNFCRDMFGVMYDESSEKIITSRLYYPYDVNTAQDRGETAYYHKSRSMNQGCVYAIDEAIKASNYKPDLYNLNLAAMSVVGVHGLMRVNAVLVNHIQKHGSDVRYHRGVKKWARHFTVPEDTCGFLTSNATLIDGFAAYVRKLNADLCGRLPGRSEYDEPEHVGSYETIRSIMFSDDQGLAIARNPNASDCFVCWTFTIDEGSRDYSSGTYGDEQVVTDEYNARLFVNTIKMEGVQHYEPRNNCTVAGAVPV